MMRELVEHILRDLEQVRDSVLVSVVQSKGSTPRHVGAQMLVSSEGLACATIGGGTVEAHAISLARDMVGQGSWRMERIELKPKGEKSLGMVCGGEASLLYTPICANGLMWRQVAEGLLDCLENRRQAYLALECPDDEEPFEGKVALLDANGQLVAGECDHLPDCSDVPRRGSVVGGHFVMPARLPVRAIVFGGGHVGAATVSALARVGFDCTVFECRSQFATPQAHPDAHHVVLGDYHDIQASLTLDERDYVLIMTHGHTFDFAVLEQVLRRPPAYVGLMASRRKIGVARQQMLQAGISEETFARVHTPIGLEIKAETPAEIAVSIAAELILHRASNGG